MGAPAANPSFVVYPQSVTLTGAKAWQQLLVEARQGGDAAGDLTPKARFVSSNPRVASVDGQGVVRPVSDGTAMVSAIVEGRKAVVPVRVRSSGKPFGWSFANHVLPVLTKTGCNSGACHGAAAGKGGLKLTLRGYDAAADHATLTRQAWGRRIVPGDPAGSLFLQKPTNRIAHGGGARFKPGSPEYGILAQWIASGCAPPSAADPELQGLEVFPPAARLRPGAEQQVLVRARYSDGHTEDVTRWVKYGTSDDSVASVDDGGKVTVKGSGEAAITLWFHSKVTFTRIASPFPKAPPAEVYARAARFNFVDDLVLKKLRALGIPPAGLASDEQFLRRASLDAAGILPTPAEVEAFLAECVADRVQARERLVDSLLGREEFNDYWAYKWSDVLLVSSRKLPAKGMWSFYHWIRRSVAENQPWDRMVYDLITASGSTLQNGAGNFFVLHKDPVELTETTSQAFLGMALTCARCHNHPLEKWTLKDYYGMANLFGRVRLKNGDLAGETLVFAADEGDVPHIRTGQPVAPRPLDGTAIPLDAPEDRRVHLAKWLTSPQNPYFARALVNRVWRNFMGRGLVEAEDDLRLTNPPSNEELLSALTNDFVRHGFDVRHLVRTIMTSAAYQRSSTPAPGSPLDGKYYSAYLPRRLPAEVLLDAISQVTGVPTEFPGYARGTRALQLPDSQVASTFLTAFGRPPRVQTCSCERQEEPNVAQALHLANGDTINGKLRSDQSLAKRLTDENPADEALLDRLYRVVYGRLPSSGERQRVLGVLQRYAAAGGTRREAVEDLLAAMLTTKEFLFNH